MDVKNCDILINGKLLVENANFNLEKNKLNVLIGHNGVGKTVVLDKIADLDNNRPDKFLNFPSKKDIIYQTQGVPFIAEITVEETLKLFENMSDTDILVHKDIPNMIKKILPQRFGNLSGGEKRFLIIWASLQISRELYLFDEPFANLDPSHIHELTRLFYDSVSEGKTLLLTTHQFEELIPQLTHIIFIDKKAVAFNGDMDKFINHSGENLFNILKKNDN